MVREHGSLTKDAETNQAAWEAARGAAYGGVKVREFGLGLHVLSSVTCLISRCFHAGCVKLTKLCVRALSSVCSVRAVAVVTSSILAYSLHVSYMLLCNCVCCKQGVAVLRNDF